jgi:hypothetical protein
MTAPLLAAALWLLAASPVSAADGPDGGVVGAEGSDVLRVVSSAQSDVEADPDSDPDRRLVDRESSERIDAVVIALWTIAGVMTVLLGFFLWHTSPRRRLRLAGGGSAGLSGEAVVGVEPAGLSGEAVVGVEPAGEAAGEHQPGEDSSRGGFEGMAREALLWLRSRLAPRREFESAAADSQQEPGGGSVDESAVWKFDEENGEQRSV